MKRIPFVEEMREAVRADWKTQTRRTGRCPYRVGDVLGIGEPHRIYVNERSSFCKLGRGELEYVARSLVCRYADGTERSVDPADAGWHRAYLAMVTVGISRNGGADFERAPRNRSGRFLPDIFVRDRIRVTAIRQERLQQITPEDARREGCPELSGSPAFHAWGTQSYVRWFAALWDTLHWKIAGERWRDDPLVHVISFERVIGS